MNDEQLSMNRSKQNFLLGMAIVLLLSIGTFPGCGKKGPKPPRPRGREQLRQVGSDEVVARIGDQTIMKTQLARLVHYYSQNLLRQGHRPPPDFEESVLDRLIESEIIYQIGLTMEFPELDRKVDEKYNELVGRYPSERALIEDLARSETTPSDLRESLRREVIVNCVLDREVYDKVMVSDEEVEKYYRDKRERLEKPERIRVRQILVSVPRLATAEQKEAARKKAGELKKLCEAGEDFEVLAREHSDDEESAPRGGALGLKRKGEWIPALEEVAWDLEPGSLSEPVETRFGYHLVLLDEKLPAGLPPIEEVRDEITVVLKAQKTPEKINQLVEGFKKKFKVKKLWSKEGSDG